MRINGLIVMGVSGCGKTTIGKLIAARLGWDFFDGDAFHTPENIARMSAGIPLTDADRASWLALLHDLLARTLGSGRHPVLACSALKAAYRRTLLEGSNGLKVVCLKGGYDLILSRMAVRPDHFMKPGMLKSQFNTLEEPEDAWIADITQPPEEIAGQIIRLIGKGNASSRSKT